MKMLRLVLLMSCVWASNIFSAAFSPIAVYVQNVSGADLQVGIIDESRNNYSIPLRPIARNDKSVQKIGDVDSLHSLAYVYTDRKSKKHIYRVTWSEIEKVTGTTPSALVAISYCGSWRTVWDFNNIITVYDGSKQGMPGCIFDAMPVRKELAELKKVIAGVSKLNPDEVDMDSINVLADVPGEIAQKMSKNELFSSGEYDVISEKLLAIKVNNNDIDVLLRLINVYMALQSYELNNLEKDALLRDVRNEVELFFNELIKT